MIKIYGMKSCPDCADILHQISGSDRYQMIDIGEDVRYMHAFIDLRDQDPAFDEIRGTGKIGIPAFIREDGTVTLDAEAVGLCRPLHFQTEPHRIYAEVDGTCVAEITFFQQPDGTYVIDHTFADASLKGRGIGTRLVELADAYIKEQGSQWTATCPFAEHWRQRHQ
ncbi:GNAT family N-acetyltransferase [Catenisphaera adipataccumulans]|uniref:Glutaredoxin-related protein/predicted GNAT family acetyltransferase n=1 Tax=Catenisphaera adipataccumulans TaxID=700500 RepID=A0A7W8FVY4_9FIRM|nr:GNAT family N-acetyltransferase [Catenisphaera adipataccumulans]MBB5182110.1 glutaredoxin-related protein/predicted GNAT family acetyltransferase [Catenisphaera adipataccumulans]